MKKKCRGKEKKMKIYDKRNAFSLQEKEAVLVAFQIPKLTREFRTLETDRKLFYIIPALW